MAFYKFLLFSLFAATLFGALFARGRARRIVILSLSMVLLAYWNGWLALLWIGISLASFFGLNGLREEDAPVWKWLIGPALLIFCLIIVKSGWLGSEVLQGFGAKSVGFLGFSYLSFRLIHYWVETLRGTISDRSLLGFVSYLFYFPAYLGGPIHRYNPFIEQLETPTPRRLEELAQGIFRVFLGLVFSLVLAEALRPHVVVDPVKVDLLSRKEAVLALLAPIFYVYFDFAGYTSIARGLSLLLGIELPENFRQPFLAQSPSEFWSRWHITLSSFIRDYFYLPVFGFARSGIQIFVGVFSSLLLFCLWHGLDSKFAVMGIYMGSLTGASAVLSPRLRKLGTWRSFVASTPGRWASRFVTILSLAAGFGLFFLEPRSWLKIFWIAGVGGQ